LLIPELPLRNAEISTAITGEAARYTDAIADPSAKNPPNASGR